MPFLSLSLLILALCTMFFVMFVVVAQILAAFTTDAPFVPVPNGLDEIIIKTLRLEPTSVLYDLGCGDARLLISAVASLPTISAVGVEIGWWPYVLAKFKTRKLKNISIKRENIFETNVSEATHVFLYLFPAVLEKLLPILEKQCSPGTRIVSCDFECPGKKPTEVVEINPQNRRGKRVVVYEI